jgi:rRNA maturation RNase YbeY
LNRRFLSHDYVTDVLSFDLEGGKMLEGEVYVNLDRARQQAQEYGVAFGNEVARLVIHGTLHLVGYDDRRPKDVRAMRSQEEKHLAYWFQ